MSEKANEKMMANARPAKVRRQERGPEPERLKIEGNWKAAVGLALRKPKPPGGWPK